MSRGHHLQTVWPSACQSTASGTFCSCSRFVWRVQPCSAVGSTSEPSSPASCAVGTDVTLNGAATWSLCVSSSLMPFRLEPRLQPRVPLLSRAVPAGRREQVSGLCWLRPAGAGWAPGPPPWSVLSRAGAGWAPAGHTPARIEWSCPASAQLTSVASAGPMSS